MKKVLRVISMLALLTFVLSGCSQGSQQEDKNNQPPTELPRLRIGVMSDVGAVPFIIAERENFFAKRGLDVEIQVFKSAVDRDTALQTGNLDGAMTDMLSIILFQEAGFPVKMTSDTYGNYKLIAASNLSGEEFEKLAEISVGLSSNTVIDFTTEKIAEAKGLGPKLSKTAIPQMPVRLEMLKTGKIHGATLPEPLASAAVLDGGTVVSSTEEFKLYPAIFIMTQEALQKNGAGVKLMYEAYNEAVDYLNSHKTEEMFDFLVEKLAFPPALEGKFSLPRFNKIAPPDAATFQITSEWMKNMGLAKNIYKYEDLTDTSVLPQ